MLPDVNQEPFPPELPRGFGDAALAGTTVIGSPDLESLTTSRVERAFLTVRQELKRFQRKGLGYSKSLEMHKLSVALHFGVYNFVRKHHTLGTTPAVAAGLQENRWSLEQVVEMTEAYWLRKKDF